MLTHQADMYSLGIIFFEMNYSFGTGMERALVLSKLRQPDIPFPAQWSSDQKSAQREVITMLLQHDPQRRPSSEQLLMNPVVPKPEDQRKDYTAIIQGTCYPCRLWETSGPED
jgi:translation initiation factor 2-alpha kinase 4